MREIKFRFWDKEHKHMEYSNNHLGDFFFKCESASGGFKDWAVIMQYTGLKDKNGKEIYEGDIIRVLNDVTLCIVEWDNKDAGFKRVFLDKKHYEKEVNYMPANINLWEIVGNIYENPELLK